MNKFFRILFAFIFLLSFSTGFSLYAQDEGEGDKEYYPTILQIENDEEIQYLESQGVIIWNQREDMLLALIPMERLDQPAFNSMQGRKDRSKRLSTRPRRAVPAMDVARSYFDAFEMHTGSKLDKTYTGRGVVVGLCDDGLDPNHIDFIGEDGKTRVKKVISLDEIKGTRTILTSLEEIEAWTSDNPNNYHGTHVAGIMAGSYSKNGLQGMAPDADIVMGGCQLYDAGILAVCEEIIAYAKSVGKPAVINLSLSNYNGPHDGSTLFNRYMDLLGEEAIICMAAGNNGAKLVSASVDFTAQKSDWRVKLSNSNWDNFVMYGMTDVWSKDSTPLKCRFHVSDGVTGQSVYSSEIMSAETDLPYHLSSEIDPEFANYFTGDVWIDSYVSDLNDRWCLEMEYDAVTDIDYSDQNKWARYQLALELIGEPGQHIDLTADGVYTWLSQWSGYAAPTANLSVSDIATGDNLVCVGMYHNRNSVPTLSGESASINCNPFTISNNSSYGTLLDGRVLPHTVAPGNNIISSISTDFIATDPNRAAFYANVAAEENGKTYYWGNMGGTSMATPYVAGTIACWLEAAPHLTIADVKDIVAQSNETDCYNATDKHNGQGWLNPYQGLLLALKHTSVTVGKVDCATVKVMVKGDVAEIFNPDGVMLSGSIFAIDGSKALDDFMVSSQHELISLSSLNQGVYIIVLTSPDSAPISIKFVK